jgi:peptidoglycan/xylan/chitin deacetylase (PgdA/CDA1 family)
MSVDLLERGRFLTVSIDDGHPTDLRTAELLARYDLRATFYVPARNPERPVMHPHDIERLARTFEVGGHTLEHRPLHRMGASEAWEEIAGCKGWLEAVIGGPVTSFCYPRGKHNRRIAGLVRKAGFRGARTTLFNLSRAPRDPFRWGVSTHAYSHSNATQVRHALLERNAEGLLRFVRIHRCARDWEEHFHHSLDWVEANGGIAHLYLHSWEIEEGGEWQKLERVLRHASHRRDLLPVTNGELFDVWHARHT